MINSDLIKAKAKSMGLRQRNIADALGIKQSTVNQKINNVRPMLLDEAEKIASLLEIRDEEFARYFFSHTPYRRSVVRVRKKHQGGVSG